MKKKKIVIQTVFFYFDKSLIFCLEKNIGENGVKKKWTKMM